MINFTNGDMFSVNAQYLVNTVNCVGVMGKGVALAFKEKFPLMFEDYQKKCNSGEIKPGYLHVWENGNNTVINFPTKRHWKNKSKYEDIQSGLEALRDLLHTKGKVTVALPALGCGHGGLNWNIVSKMIEKELSDVDATIFVFEPNDSHNIASLEKTNASINKEIDFKKLIKHTPKQGIFAAMPGYYIGDISIVERDCKLILSASLNTDSEVSALKEITKKIRTEKTNVTFSLIYKNNKTNVIIQTLINYGFQVTLYLPFGIRKVEPILIKYSDNKNVLLISLFPPNIEWDNNSITSIQHKLLELDYKFLITEQEPEWLASSINYGMPSNSLYLIKYKNTELFLNNIDNSKNLNLLGKKPDTNEPNLEILFKNSKNPIFNTETNDYIIDSKKINELLSILNQYDIQNDVQYLIKIDKKNNLVNDLVKNILKDFDKKSIR